MKANYLKAVSSFLALTLMAAAIAGCAGTSQSPPASPPSSSASAPAPAVSASAPDQKEEYNFIIAHGSSEKSVNHWVAQRFGDLISEKSGGRMKVSIYPSAQLGKTRELIEGTISGNIDFFPYVSNGFVEFVKCCAVFDMASLSPSLEVTRKVLDDPDIVNYLKPEFEKVGLKFFGFSDAGFRQLTTNREIRSLADFKGLKVRVMENKNQIAYWTALGANPTPMDYSEVYIGLQQGTIDAQENPLDLLVDAKFYEVQKYLVKTSHIPFSLIMPMNLKKYNSLPDDLKKIIDESAVQANKDCRDWADSMMAEYEKTLADSGMETIILSDEVYAQMKDKASASYDLIRQQVGGELVDKMLGVVQKYS